MSKPSAKSGFDAHFMEHALTTKDCIVNLMKVMGTLRIDQLLKYFRCADNANNAGYYIKELIDSSVLSYDKSTNEVTYNESLRFNRDPILRRIIAFWIPAYMGFENVQELYVLRYPSQILLVTESNENYDISVCVTPEEGAFVNCVRDLHLVSDVSDNVNHIAVVQNHVVGEEILKYGFDSYCILDDDKTPHYYTL